MKFFLSILSLFYFSMLIGQDSTSIVQPIDGPGGANYLHAKVIESNYAQNPDGYWVYEPAEPRPDSAHVVVFVHGYGAYNPMIYGQWIKHIVRKGNIVIFPRYQKNLFSPKPKHFTKNVATAIQNALVELDTGAHVKPITKQLSFVSHSYGGVISANLGVNFEEHNIPKPQAIMLCSPGSGIFRGAVLDSYEKMPADIRLLVMVSEDDNIVGDKIGRRIYETAIHTSNRNLIRQFRDYSNQPRLTAGHNECYSVDKEFDSGVRNFTAKRALRISKVDMMDYHGYWKLFDALLSCSRSGNDCEYAFGNTPEQRSLGLWSDGTMIKELEVTIPENTAISKANKQLVR